MWSPNERHQLLNLSSYVAVLLTVVGSAVVKVFISKLLKLYLLFSSDKLKEEEQNRHNFFCLFVLKFIRNGVPFLLP